MPGMGRTLYVTVILIVSLNVCAQKEPRATHLTAQLSGQLQDSARVRVLTELALEYRINDTVKALQLLREASELAAVNSDMTGLGRCYETLGKIRYYHGNYRQAISDFEASKSFFKQADVPEKFANVLVDQGNAFLFLSRYDTALTKYDSARSVFADLEYVPGLVRSINNMGIIYKNFGRYQEALQAYNQVIELSLRKSDSLSLIDTYINIGVVHVKQGNYHKALENFSKSLYYARQTGNKKQETISLMNSGVVYNKLKEYEKALDHYQQALEVSEQMNDKVEISRCLTNIGTNYIPMGQYDLAESYIQRGLAIKKELGEKRSIANAYNFLGEIAYHRGNYRKAIELDMQAIQLKHEVNDPEGLARCFTSLGRTFLAAGALDEAYRYADSAMHYSMPIGAIEHITSAYFLQKEVMQQRGDFKQAYALYDLYKRYSDSLMNENKARAVKEIEFKYESRVLEEENERLKVQAQLDALLIERNRKIVFILIPAIILLVLAIVLLFTIQRRQKKFNAELTRKNKVITRQNMKLDDYNRTKDKILSVITHDIRGTIGNQMTALSVLAQDQFRDEEERNVVLSRLANSSALSLGMLENLALWTRLREGSLEYKPAAVNLSGLIDEVEHEFSRSVTSKELQWIAEKEDPLICLGDRRMIKNVLSNLVSNAIKFSYRGGEIHIAAGHSDNKVVVKITDRGTGMTEGEILNAGGNNLSKGRRGTENEKGSGLGLALVRSFLAFHESELLLESRDGEGTTVSFVLKPATGAGE